MLVQLLAGAKCYLVRILLVISNMKKMHLQTELKFTIIIGYFLGMYQSSVALCPTMLISSVASPIIIILLWVIIPMTTAQSCVRRHTLKALSWVRA